jgi:hypothetical protein
MFSTSNVWDLSRDLETLAVQRRREVATKAWLLHNFREAVSAWMPRT